MTSARFASANGRLPKFAQQAGFEQDHEILYVARASHEGGVHPGKYRADWKAASISYGGREIWLSAHDVWVGHLSDGSGGVWNLPAAVSDAVICGHEADGTPLHAARAHHEGGLHPGKWRADWKAASIGFGGQELWLTSFQVLCPGQYIDGDDAFSWQH
jgi:hypothetical protein